MPILSELDVYPVKGCAGIALETSTLGERGVPGDRLEPERLVLEAPGQAPLGLSRATPGPAVQVTVWDDACRAVDAGDGAAAWFEQHLGHPARLVRMDTSFERRANPELAPEGQLSFADAYPVLIISRPSLDDLASRVKTPLKMNRFRPNLVVEGCQPFEEDRWRRLRVGGAVLRLVKPCVRCVATTVEQETAEAGHEPLRTLATFRRWEGGGVIFGQNAVVEVGSRVRVGDPVEVLDLGEPPVLERISPP